MSPGLVEEDGGSIADVEGIDTGLHRDENLLIACSTDFGTDPFPFRSENDADIGVQPGIWKEELIGVRMGGDATDAGVAQLAEGNGKGGAEEVRDSKDGAHAGADGATQVGVGRRFPNNQGLDSHRGSIPQDQTNVDGIGNGIDRGEKAGLWQLKKFLEGGGTWNTTETKDALKQGEPGEAGEDFLRSNEEVDRPGMISEDQLVFRQPAGRQQDGNRNQRGVEKAAHHLFSFSNKHPFAEVIDLGAHVDVGRQARVVEVINLVELEHGQLERRRGAPILLRQNATKEPS